MALNIIDVKTAGCGGSAVTSLTLPATAVVPSGFLASVMMITGNVGGGAHQAPTDNFGNTYTQIGTTQTSSGSTRQSSWYAQDTHANGSTALTVTLHLAAGDLITGTVWAVSGEATSSYNGDTVTSNGDVTQPQSGASSPAPSGTSMFFGVLSLGNVAVGDASGTGWNTTGANGFTTAMRTASQFDDNGIDFSVFSEYLISASAQDAIWITISATTWIVRVASFLQLVVVIPPPHTADIYHYDESNP